MREVSDLITFSHALTDSGTSIYTVIEIKHRFNFIHIQTVGEFQSLDVCLFFTISLPVLFIYDLNECKKARLDNMKKHICIKRFINEVTDS